MAPTSEVDILGNVSNHVYYLLLLVELQTLLREISEAYGLADVKLPAVRLLDAKKEFYEGALSCSVVAYDSHLLITGEVIVEVL